MQKFNLKINTHYYTVKLNTHTMWIMHTLIDLINIAYNIISDKNLKITIIIDIIYAENSLNKSNKSNTIASTGNDVFFYSFIWISDITCAFIL